MRRTRFPARRRAGVTRGKLLVGYTSRMPKLSIVMPIYNERLTIERALARALRAPLPAGLAREIIAIDDGSNDGTAEFLATRADIVAVRLHRNRGKGAALCEGFRRATGDYIVIQDADLEYDPAEYPALLAPLLRRETEVVYGARFGPHSRVPRFSLHRLANRLLTALSNFATGLELSDMETGYKAFSRRAAERITPKLTSPRFGIEPEFAARIAEAGLRVKEVPISYAPRTLRQGKKLRGWKDGPAALLAILRFGFTASPRRLLKGSVVALALAGFSAAAAFAPPLVSDPDSFYHLAHSAIYAERGIGFAEFPWTQFSVIKEIGADLWYGFHILGIPLANGADTMRALRLGEFAVMFASLLVIVAAFRALRVTRPFLWTLFLAFASADLLYRLAMFRPHPLSLALALLLFAFLAREKRGNALIRFFLLGFLASWLHLSLLWLPFMVVLAVCCAKAALRRPLPFFGVASWTAGVFLGIFARPNPSGALRLAYIQVARLMQEKSLPLQFGIELRPFAWENFVDQFIPLAVFLLAGIAFYLWFSSRRPSALDAETHQTLIPAAALTALFAALAFLSARRAGELAVGFAAIFLAILWNALRKKNLVPRAILFLAIPLVLFMIGKNLFRVITYLPNAYDPTLFRDAALYLRDHSQPGEIVFNPHWDRFGHLFLWNQSNYYINGMDPIFEYAYDPRLYWKTHFIAKDQAGALTCGAIRCTPATSEETYSVLKRDFRASYIAVEKFRLPNFAAYVASDARFTKVFEDARVAVYTID